MSRECPTESWGSKLIALSKVLGVFCACLAQLAEELYDLKADPYEMHNLAADARQASRLASMRAELKEWMKQQGDTQTVFGKPLLIGDPVTLLPEGGP